MEDCGPLINASQFLPERAIGEMAKSANTARNLEIHLLNQYLQKYAVRMLHGGLRIRFDENNFESDVRGESDDDDDIDDDDEDDGEDCRSNDGNVRYKDGRHSMHGSETERG